MNASPSKREGGPPARETAPSSNQYKWVNTPDVSVNQDLFALAKETYTIADVWLALRLEGTPKPSCKSPFREDRSPSFSIFDNGRAWFDHATAEGGDVIEFIRHALDGSHNDAREWLRERIGIDRLDYWPETKPRRSIAEPKPSKLIDWPAELVEGTTETWEAFAKLRGLTYSATWVLVQAGILRFCKIDGIKCFVITDASRHAAEIRRVDRKPFGQSKAYPLPGVDKSWMPGLELLRQAPPSTAILITEGATDLISAVDLYARYRRKHGGKESWQPMALLGATCRNLHPDVVELIRGRRVRIVPDGDDAGDGMAENWSAILRKIGCTVDVVNLPRDTDLTDHLSTLPPSVLFSL